MANRDIQLEILMGLPGSGKTTFAKNRVNENTVVIHLDDVAESLIFHKNKTLRTLLQAGMPKINKKIKTVIVDGLFLTNKEVLSVLNYFAGRFNHIDVVIHQWDEDRETCLKNDGGRRDVSSSFTIQNAVYEEFNKNNIKEHFPEGNVSIIKVEKHNVLLKDGWERCLRPLIHLNNGKINSEKWCEGGTYGSCYHDGLTNAHVDDPLDFTELDELIEKIAPNITFLHYKKIIKQCVEKEYCFENDYYGGCVHYAYWVGDLKKIYELLVEFGYIQSS